MRLLHFIEDKYWLFFVLGILLGFVFPQSGEIFGDHLMFVLMVILFFTFMRMDFTEMVFQAKRPLLLSYILVGQLIVLPVLCFFLTWTMEPDLRLSIFLLAALPAGTAAPALTEIVRGRTTLSLIITVLAYLMVPITIPLLFYVFFSTWIQIDYFKLFTQLALFILIPMICARVVRRYSTRFIERWNMCFKSVMVILMALVIMVIIGKEADYILAHPSEMVMLLAILFVVFFLFQLTGYFMVFWMHQDDKVAVSITKSAMNNVLGIVLAASFFSPKVALIMVLSEVPWDVMPMFYKLYRRYLP
ncbi:MAG TPA: bile acid:sodium symporter [Deltaproteobacteria bacterium]|nr:bile acid:sodium symporter [Deltaproteobacteria bacterium]HPJ94820.1 bile acid:sodium symporter [Deltaproteobacteria bacterium]HPR52684.1 bile acid:sodium symporter [Deltaproteobacteria bacterium]